ncbi:MAG: chitobiase/beta-hexosaminidase C-terminal domain-containing protein, partial [Muribaculaceae bacterium]|nr:chitobiase/beta-hexosaminidase C-terminal domain-containing protein [Muribaculaceae bacterium]
MKKSIIVMGVSALLGMGVTTRADEPGGTGHTTEVIPGDWDDDDPQLKFEFQDIPQASFIDLRLILSCGLPDAYILYTTDAKADPKDTNAWTRYTEPIELKEDCTVRFFARCEGYDDSDIQAYTFVYADHQASAPTVAPDIDRKNIVMTTETPNAVIRYTFDGGDPDESSQVYEGPVVLTANGTFKAKSFANGMFPSVLTEYTVDFLKAEMPSANFENKHLVLSSTDADSKLHYTLEDAPTADIDAWTLYSTPVALTEDCTVRYFASQEGYHDSEVGSFSFFFSDYQVAAPVLTADADGTHVVMACGTEGAEIRYTTDGSEPSQQSALYSAPVEIVSNGTFRARAFADGLFESNIVDFIVMHMAVPTPSAIFENKKLTLSCSDSKATLWYTTEDNATPSDLTNWIEYKAPLELTENCTVRFFGRRDGFNDSDIQSFAFIYSNYRVADPTIERNAEGTHIVMESSTPGATIYYTFDGTEPTTKSAVYSSPILIEGNFTFNAFAVADGLFDSKVNRYVVSNMAAPNPTATFANLRMSLACPDEKARILYTTDSEAAPEDASAWTLYTAPFEMTGDCTLRFFSRRDNFNDSDIESLTFVYSAYQAQAPAIGRNDQGTHIVMESAVEGGVIRYTSDGSEPSVSSEIYEKPVRIQEGAVYRARVFADNMYASEISEYVIGNDKLAVPTATYDNFMLVLSTADEGASIWYTTDPELSLDNVEAWTLYEAP